MCNLKMQFSKMILWTFMNNEIVLRWMPQDPTGQHKFRYSNGLVPSDNKPLVTQTMVDQDICGLFY